MPTAKSDLINRIRTLHSTINNTDALKGKELTQVEHNEIARMLRNGLAVVGFAALEDFIKRRTSEAMTEISSTSVAFSDLPDKLQIASTYEAISALSYQLSIRDKSVKVSYVQEQALNIASTATNNFDISPHSFGYNQANVNDETVKKILASLHVDNPWQQMTLLASRVGLVALPLQESYKNASSRRHRAAHVAMADTPELDILQFVNEAFSIAIGFDTLLSLAVRKVSLYDRDYLSGTNKITAQNVKFRFVRFVDNNWKEFVEGSTRAFRVNSELSQIRVDAMHRAASNNQTYVEFDDNGILNCWNCN